MELDVNEVVEISNGKRYIVVDILEDNYQKYYFLLEINDDNEVLTDYIVAKSDIEAGKRVLKPVDDNKVEEKFKARLS